ncbi:MAG: hypothetical protein KGJ57_08755 [Sphingomonadales bacterium]|nr:hypothetical protein [Sphingomonadales bacterium]MDE2169499.1 hypothetical protein [Sphingomonadales bacterium]
MALTIPTRRPLPRRIARSRMVAGIALHCLVPAYGLTLIGDALWGQTPMSWAQWLPHALALGGRFLVIYGLGAVALTLLTAAVERIAPQRTGAGEQDADARSGHAALMQAMARARGRLGPEGDALLDRLSDLTLDLDDSSTRDMLRDMARLLDAGAAAAPIDAATRDMLNQRSLAALETLVDALEQKARDNAVAALDEVHTLANYVAAKYGEKID